MRFDHWLEMKDIRRSNKEEIDCLRFNHGLEMRDTRKNFNTTVIMKQKSIKEMTQTIIDQREMTCEMLDEVNMAKNTARIMSKKAEQAFKSSTGKQQKLIDKADIIHSLQDQLASISNDHKIYVDKQERRLVELDMEKSEKLQNWRMTAMKL